MGVPILAVGYISATTGRGDHEVHKGHVVALEKKPAQFLLLPYGRTSIQQNTPGVEVTLLSCQ
jgi:hypothetical protein